MSEAFENIELNSVNDFSFFGKIIGQRMRNPNFLSVRRETFMKSLIQQIKPFCSHKTLQRIQKSINQIAQQKEADRREQKQRQKKKNNKKDKNLVTVKQYGRTDQYGVQVDDYNDYDDDDDDYDEDDQYEMDYKK